MGGAGFPCREGERPVFCGAGDGLAQVARARAIALLSGQVGGVRRLYRYLAAQADSEGYATLNLTALSQQWGRPRTTLIYWYEKLRRLRLLQEMDPGGGCGRPSQW